MANYIAPGNYGFYLDNHEDYSDYPMQLNQQPEQKSPIWKGIKYGVLVGLFIVAVWFIWAVVVYRWSVARVSSIITEKYMFDNQDALGNDYLVSIDNVRFSPAKDRVWFVVHLKPKTHLKDIKDIDASYYCYTSEDQCKLTDKTCIIV